MNLRRLILPKLKLDDKVRTIDNKQGKVSAINYLKKDNYIVSFWTKVFNKECIYINYYSRDQLELIDEFT